MKEQLEKLLNTEEFDSPVKRAELLRDVTKCVYNFVKLQRPEGGGFDGRDGPERNSIADIVDAAENHYFEMLGKHQ